VKPITFISAGAGSGKTYRLTEYLQEELIKDAGEIRPEAVLATTFTKKAASELIERVRQKLIENGKISLSNSMEQALIGTVNSVCGRILKRYAFEAGLSPELEVIVEDEASILFAQALEQTITPKDVRHMNQMAWRLSQEDWRKEVHQVVNLARSNDIPADKLDNMADESITQLLAFFPSTSSRNFKTDLLKAIDQSIAEISASGDGFKNTLAYLDLLRFAKRGLEQDRLKWSDWAKLSKAEPSKKSLQHAMPVLDIAANFESNSKLHKDITDWISSVFSLAGRAMETYQLFKAQRGLMDFVDQEKQVLDIIDLPDVSSALAQELDLLMVDEFQDTSPIQLGVFMKLSELAKQTVWVGDVKQAIYGFRGSDPELMNSIVDGLQKTGGVFEILPKSWRSRPQLVHLTNDLFVPAFSDILAREKVELKPALVDYDQSALEFWMLDGKNQGLRCGALARGVSDLLNEGRMVMDKETKQLRPLRPNDIALLSRTNLKAAGYTNALIDLGIPVSISKEGLMQTPEAVLALACLRYLVDPSDSLASAEIISMNDLVDPETWLQDRLEYLANNHSAAKWGLNGSLQSQILQDLDKKRTRMLLFSPAEALEAVLQIGNIEQTVKTWGPTQERSVQRLANLEALRGYVMDYEDSCRRQRGAATAGGFILWLKTLAGAELDKRGRDEKVDAVQVLTHHSAKGLEWPVVICADLDTSPRDGYWGANMISDSELFDFQEPLAVRHIRYWVKPFGQQSKGINVYDRIKNSSIAEEAQEKQLAEAKRLLYVSITRARDLIILPMKKSGKGNHWLDILDADWLIPTNTEINLPCGETITCRRRELETLENVAQTIPENTFLWFGHDKKTPTAKISAMKSPSSFEPVPGAEIGKVIQFGKRLSIHGSPHPQMNIVGDALHGVFAFDFTSPGLADRKKIATKLINRYGLQTNLDTDELMTASENLQQLLKKEFQAEKYHPEWPIQNIQDNGQIVKGWVDLVIETPEGLVIIDHKSFPGSKEDMKKKALEYSGQLMAYKTALEAATGKPVLSQWINFAVSGYLVEINL